MKRPVARRQAGRVAAGAGAGPGKQDCLGARVQAPLPGALPVPSARTSAPRASHGAGAWQRDSALARLNRLSRDAPGRKRYVALAAGRMAAGESRRSTGPPIADWPEPPASEEWTMPSAAPSRTAAARAAPATSRAGCGDAGSTFFRKPGARTARQCLRGPSATPSSATSEFTRRRESSGGAPRLLPARATVLAFRRPTDRDDAQGGRVGAVLRIGWPAPMRIWRVGTLRHAGYGFRAGLTACRPPCCGSPAEAASEFSVFRAFGRSQDLPWGQAEPADASMGLVAVRRMSTVVMTPLVRRQSGLTGRSVSCPR